jgi:membrane-bound serine protease (ClpP class)
LFLGYLSTAVAADGPLVGLVKIDGAIDAISARFLSRAIGSAEDDGAALVVIELDTPGGRLDSTREMVESILGSEVPVAVYVSPSGAQAASAGTFITAAANFAVMAPVTNIGAASPVSGTGEDLPETLKKKINEDTQAFIRAIAEARGRNSDALEATVTEARAYSASEAIEIGIADLIATDLDDLMRQLDGRTATTAAGDVVLDLAGAEVKELKKTLLESFLTVIADPNIAFLLISIGSIALMAEFFSPGVFGPGVVGVLGLLLAFVAFGQLPVNWAGVALILFAMGLLYFELQAPGIGVFGVGGTVAFLLGAFFLFGGFFESSEIPEPTVEVNRWLLGGTTVVLVAGIVSMYFLAREGGSASGYVSTSDTLMIGRRGVTLSDLRPSGTVRIDDEEWSATTELSQPISEGHEVEVVDVYTGGLVKVARVPAEVAGGRGSVLGTPGRWLSRLAGRDATRET